MASSLEELFKHNLWANRRLIDACAKLSDEQLDASAPGTFGRVRDTLVHIARAEGWLLGLLTGEQAERPSQGSNDFPGFEELRARLGRSGERLIAAAPEIDPAKVIQVASPRGTRTVSAAVIIVQAINHATEHRGHVNSIISQQGIEPIAVDGWAYGRELLG